jgi:hypothetical protein
MGYAEFHVLKVSRPCDPTEQIPDLPPEGHVHPQGTDESERHMPGQEFILVEGIFTAGSDAVVCVIQRIDRRKGKRERKRSGFSPEQEAALSGGTSPDLRDGGGASGSIGGSGSGSGSGSWAGSGSVGSTSTGAGSGSGTGLYRDRAERTPRRSARRVTDPISWVDTGLGLRLQTTTLEDEEGDTPESSPPGRAAELSPRQRDEQRQGQRQRQASPQPQPSPTPAPAAISPKTQQGPTVGPS